MDNKTEKMIDEAIHKMEEHVNKKLAQEGYVLLSEAWDIFKEHLGIAPQNVVWTYPDD